MICDKGGMYAMKIKWGYHVRGEKENSATAELLSLSWIKGIPSKFSQIPLPIVSFLP